MLAGVERLLAMSYLQIVRKERHSMSCTKLIGIVALLALLFCSSNIQAAIDVDGNLADWGISVNSQNNHLTYDPVYAYSYNASNPLQDDNNLTPRQTTYNGTTVYYDVEDTNDSAGNGSRVGPLYGGQDYDAEVMVVRIVGNNLYIGIATGQTNTNLFSNFAPGDICITTADGTVFGIEVGGGSGVQSTSGHGKGSPRDTTVDNGDAGSTYKLFNNGFTDKVNSPGNDEQTAGSIWETTSNDWIQGLSGSDPTDTDKKWDTAQLNTQDGEEALGYCDSYVYNFGSSSSQHAFIELCITDYVNVFGSDLSEAIISWTPACGNDLLYVFIPEQSGHFGPVPEPASMTIWAFLLLMGICFARKKISSLSRP
jgi:hypothetical protein